MKILPLCTSFLSLVALAFATPATANSIASSIIRQKVIGIDVIAGPIRDVGLVTIRGSFPAGDVFNPPGNPALASLVAGMLDKGTTKQDKFELARQLEESGASIAFTSGSHTVQFTIRCLREDLALVLGLLAEQLRAPAFSPGEFEKLKKQRLASLKRSLDDTSSRANEAFARAVYAPGHPNYPATVAERSAATEATTVEDLRAFHARTYGPAHLTLVAVGDLELPTLHAEVARAFDGWSGGVAIPESPLVGSRPRPAGAEIPVVVPGKASVNFVWGQSHGLTHRDADALALRLATGIFGTGFTGRLMSAVRDKDGLSYGVHASVTRDTYAGGDFRIAGTFAPSLLDRGIASIRRQLEIWHVQGVTAAEVEARKSQFIGAHQVSLASTEGLADAILSAVNRGYELVWLDEYPRRVAALTPEQVNAAIKRHLNPDQMVLVKSGTIPAGN